MLCIRLIKGGWLFDIIVLCILLLYEQKAYETMSKLLLSNVKLSKQQQQQPRSTIKSRTAKHNQLKTRSLFYVSPDLWIVLCVGTIQKNEEFIIRREVLGNIITYLWHTRVYKSMFCIRAEPNHTSSSTLTSEVSVYCTWLCLKGYILMNVE